MGPHTAISSDDISAPLNFNVYSNPAGTVPWNSTNPISQSVSVDAGGTATGRLVFYGRIAPGQLSPVGNYQAFLFNTVLGFLSISGANCQPLLGDLNALDFTLFVTATVPEACTLGTTEAVDFGTPAGLWTRADAAGAVQVFCPSNVRWTLAFGAGLYPAGDERRMRSDTGEHVAYRLYRDSARSQLIGVNDAIAGTGSGSMQSIPVYGRIEAPRSPTVGTYSDTVVVVLSF